MIDDFLRPKLTGARFSGHAIPLEFLRDLAVLEEMIIEVAKWKYRNEFPTRSRIPRGFTKGIQLQLSHIESGSTVAVISLLVGAGELFTPANQEYFESARDSIIAAIAAAENGEEIDDIPQNALTYFDRFGRSLRADEAIELSSSQHPKPARLTVKTRRKLLLASSEAKEFTEEIEVRGVIPAADQYRRTCQFQLISGKKIESPIPTTHFDSIIDAFNGYRSGMRILLQGVGLFNQDQRLKKIESIEHISTLDPLDVPARLEEIRLLKNGWLEGHGKPPDMNGLDWFSQVFEKKYPDNLPLPRVFPTEKGGIQLEWRSTKADASLEIDLIKRIADWHVLDLDTDKDESEELNLEEESDWERLIELLQHVTPEGSE